MFRGILLREYELPLYEPTVISGGNKWTPIIRTTWLYEPTYLSAGSHKRSSTVLNTVTF